MLLWVRAVAGEGKFDVSICEPDVSPLAIQGPKAEDWVAKLISSHIRSIKYFGCIETSLQGIPLVLCRSGWSKQGGFELFLRDGNKGDALWGELGGIRRQGIWNRPWIAQPLSNESKVDCFPGAAIPAPDSNPFEANMEKFVDVSTEVNYIAERQHFSAQIIGGPRAPARGLDP